MFKRIKKPTWWDIAFMFLGLALIYITVNLVILAREEIRLKQEIEEIRKSMYID